MFATNTSDNKDDLVGHEGTVHEGSCSAADSDSDFNVKFYFEIHYFIMSLLIKLRAFVI